jgi:hypothetical protein
MPSGTIFVSAYILQSVCVLFTLWCFDMAHDGGEQFQGADELLLLLLMPPVRFVQLHFVAQVWSIYMMYSWLDL